MSTARTPAVMIYYCLLILTALLSVIEANSSVSDVKGLEKAKSCPKEGCPNGPTPDGDGEGSSDLPMNMDDGEDTNRISDLAEVPDSPWWNLLTKAKTELAKVTKTLYDTLNTIASSFAEIVRKIMNEELYDIMATLLTKVGYLMFKPGEALYELFEAILSAILLLACFICSYVLLKVFPLLFIVAFLSTIFLLHYFVGPLAIFKGMYVMGKHLLSVTWIIGTYPYQASAVIILLIVIGFCLSIVMTIWNWSAERRERRQRKELYHRVRTLESNQGQMLEILNEWRRYTEIRRNAYI